MNRYSDFSLRPGDKVRHDPSGKEGYVCNVWGRMDKPNYDRRFIMVKWANWSISDDIPVDAFTLIERNPWNEED